MFDILFGWRKASKCKRLIRRVQCRLKVLKNKRTTIVRQLREDVAELLKHGHGQTAFDRVEHLFKDECLVSVYDLLDNFCEFIISNLHYIRRNKDYPNDINQAVSSLIFASARFGDLPELITIRKLFGERYGQRFATVALELLPGNLVNRQLQEKMSVKSVSDDEKSRLVEEILRSTLKKGPLLLEYSSELQQKLENENSADPIPGVETSKKPNDGDKIQLPKTDNEEKKLVLVDSLTSNSTLASICSINAQQTPLDTVESSHSSAPMKNRVLMTKALEISPCGDGKTGPEQLERSLVVYDSDPRHREEIEIAVIESSSESSAQMPEEMIYLDDIQELEPPPLSKENSFPDQRLFKFRSSAVSIRGRKFDKSKDESPDQGGEEDLQEHKSAPRSLRKNRNASSKRLGRRSVSGDIATATNMNDAECAIYYGESCDSSPDYDRICHDRQRHDHKKIPIEVRSSFRSTKYTDYQTRSNSNVKRTLEACSSEHPCDSTPHNPTIHLQLSHCCCSCRGNQQKKDYDEAARSPTLLLSTCSGSSSSSSSASVEEKPSYLRAMTMPLERPKDHAAAIADVGVFRSNSFPFRELGMPSNRHVHPNLPDYDELAARFTALKNANLQGGKIMRMSKH